MKDGSLIVCFSQSNQVISCFAILENCSTRTHLLLILFVNPAVKYQAEKLFPAERKLQKFKLLYCCLLVGYLISLYIVKFTELNTANFRQGRCFFAIEREKGKVFDQYLETFNTSLDPIAFSHEVWDKIA